MPRSELRDVNRLQSSALKTALGSTRATTGIGGSFSAFSSSVASSFETARSLSSGARSRDPLAPPQDEVLNPHGEERGNAARLEPCGPGYAIMIRLDRNTL